MGGVSLRAWTGWCRRSVVSREAKEKDVLILASAVAVKPSLWIEGDDCSRGRDTSMVEFGRSYRYTRVWTFGSV
jgi:hypothetical protein